MNDKPLTILGIDAQVFGVGVAVVTTLLVLAQVSEGRKQRRLFEMQTQRELSQAWELCRRCWVMATVVTRGPSSYYALSDSTVIEEFRAYQEAADAMAAATDQSLGIEALANMGNILTLHDRERETRKVVEQQIRRLLRFLDEVACLVLRGRLRPQNLYTLLGADVVRSTGVLRRLIGESFEKAESDEATCDAPVPGPRTFPHVVAEWLEYYPAMRIRILLLSDILWAQACVAGELEASDSAGIAVSKSKSGSGQRSRRLVFRACSGLSGPIRATANSIRLAWLLTASEYPKLPPTRGTAWHINSGKGVMRRLTRPGRRLFRLTLRS